MRLGGGLAQPLDDFFWELCPMAFLGATFGDSESSRSKTILLPLLDLDLFVSGVKVHAFLNSFSVRFIVCSLAARCSMERSYMPMFPGGGAVSPNVDVNVPSVGRMFQTNTRTHI